MAHLQRPNLREKAHLVHRRDNRIKDLALEGAKDNSRVFDGERDQALAWHMPYKAGRVASHGQPQPRRRVRCAPSRIRPLPTSSTSVTVMMNPYRPEQLPSTYRTARGQRCIHVWLAVQGSAWSTLAMSFSVRKFFRFGPKCRGYKISSFSSSHCMGT